MEQENFIYEPPEANVDWKPKRSERGGFELKKIRVGELLEGKKRSGSGIAREENRRRLEGKEINNLERIDSANRSVICYLSEKGHWLVDRRNSKPDSYRYSKIEGRIDSIQKQIGASILLRSTDIGREGGQWHRDMRFLEGERGLTVAAQTKENPYGYYAGYLESAHLSGYRMDDKEVTAIRVTNAGIPTLSRESEAPRHRESGLNYVHPHDMAVAHYVNNEWGQSHVIPSGDLVLPGANTTAIQYAQSGFEGGCGKGQERDGKDVEAKIEEEAIPVQATGEGEVIIFRIEELAKRFQKTASAIAAPPVPLEQFKQTVIEVVRQNVAYMRPGCTLYIRPYIMGTKGGAGANRAEEYLFIVEVFPYGEYFTGPDDGIVIEGRLDIHRPGAGADKMAANYVSIFAEKQRARKRKSVNKGKPYNDILSFDKEGKAEEGTSCSIFFVKEFPDGRLGLSTSRVREDENTPELQRQRHSLDSITRRSIFELCERLGIPYEKEGSRPEQIQSMLGCFTAGNAAGITRVEEIDIRQNGEDENPLVCRFDNDDAKNLIRLLYDYLSQARIGKLTDPRLRDLNERWVTRINVKAEDFMKD